MPIVSVRRDRLFDAIGKEFTQEEFEGLCFDFGIELDDVTSEAELVTKMKGAKAAEGLSRDIIYKIDIPANRYDLLCCEGLTRALRVFLNMEDPPKYKLVTPASPLTMTVLPETATVRPFIVCAVLRGMTFTQETMQSFIDLQDKLHQNICRERSLVAIGTHDLDKLTPPFTYEALKPDNIKFQALKEKEAMSANELFAHYKAKEVCSVRKYIALIDKSPVYPVIYDANRNVLSLPPIINSHLSRITTDTRNVFIECTATDLTKAHIVLNTIVCMFSQYTSAPFTCEPVSIIHPDKSRELTPNLKTIFVEASPATINRGIGTKIEPSEMITLLHRMQIKSQLSKNDTIITAEVPATRSDVLHACDILEDVAIAYGFNNIVKTVPQCYTMARQQPIGMLSDQIRRGVAEAGFSEVLTWALVSTAENFENVRQENRGEGVTVGNPKTLEFEMVRTSLIPGVLKTLAHNRANLNLPIRLFELSDVCLIDDTNANGARNERRLGGVYCARTAGFDVIHGLLDRVMTLNHVYHSDSPKEITGKPFIGSYRIVASTNQAFLPNLRADVMFTATNKSPICLGSIGVVHPEVLENFGIDSPCSMMEICIEPLLHAGAPPKSV